MLFLTSSGTFIGFTKKQKCSNCLNLTEFQLFQEKVKQELIFIPLGTHHAGVFKICPVCEKKEVLANNGTIWMSNKTKQLINDLLNSGKEKTRIYLMNKQDSEKKLLFKLLNDLDCGGLVKYYSGY
jgi:hypothetical protein